MTIEEESLKKMRERGGTWACYENQAFDSASAGHRIYLQFGPGCTHETPPTQAPDGAHGPGWKYRFIGQVNLDKGTVS